MRNTNLFTLLIGIFSIIVPIGLYLWSSSDKTITFEVLSSSTLINADQIEGFEVTFDDKIVENVTIHNLRIENSGTDPIRKSDFEQSMRIEYKEPNAEILRAEFKNLNPRNVNVEFHLLENQISIEPLLLNSGESFEVEIFSTANELPELNARISGSSIETVVSFGDVKKTGSRIVELIFGVLLLGLYSRFYWLAWLQKNNRPINIVSAFISCSAGVILCRELLDPFNNLVITLFIAVGTMIVGKLVSKFEIKNATNQRQT